MKKILVSILLVLSLSISSFAFAPLGIPAWYFGASVVLHVSAAAVGLYYAMVPGSQSTVSPTGTISRPSEAVWIDLTLPAPSVVSAGVSAKMPLSTARQLASKTDSSSSLIYPHVNSALNGSYVTPLDMSTSVGSIVSVPGKTIQVTSITVINAGNGCWAGDGNLSYQDNGYVFRQSSGGCGSMWVKDFYYTVSTPPPPAPLPDPVAVSNLSTSGGGLLKSSYQAELDKMFQDPDYVPSFTDGTTGLPYSPPPDTSVASPVQVVVYNNHQAAAAAAAQAASSSAAAATAAQTASGVAAANAAAANAASAANPGDSGLAAAAAAANAAAANAAAAAAAAQATADQQAADAAAKTADEADESIITPLAAGAAYGDGSTFDFGARMSSFITDMKRSGLFSLPGQVLGNIPSGGTSAFNVSFGRFGSTIFDLADYSSSIAVMRTLVLIVFSVAGLRIILLKGGS